MIFTDQLQHKVELNSFPKRIVSLVPSQSELLWDLGLRDEIVGITKFCVHPVEMFHSVERIGGTKTLNIEKIRSLKPDLIIGNKEENEKTQIEILQKEFPVWMSDIYNLEDALNMMQLVGELVNKPTQAHQIKYNIENSFLNLQTNQKTGLYLIWNNPYMAAGKATFIGNMLHRISIQNVLDENSRYPELSIEEIITLNPEIIFLSSEPYPFKEIHIEELQKKLPSSKVILVDGELFSWYGSRLLKSVNYFNKLIKLL
ncbi:MAG: ABC transporter substrate-binding protein [Bacteroidia bacterium]|nr:ABC transporter substrate-binding protein [Bacteroidia bacterium]